MGFRNWPIWIKTIIILLIIFIVSEIFLRFIGLKGIFSLYSINILLEFTQVTILIILNLILLLVSVLLPAYLANNFTKNSPKDYEYEIKGKGDIYNSKIFIKAPSFQYNAEGKGLLYGSIIALAYILFDFLILKNLVLSSCSDPCGIENLVASFIAIFYLILGLILIKDK